MKLQSNVDVRVSNYTFFYNRLIMPINVIVVVTLRDLRRYFIVSSPCRLDKLSVTRCVSARDNVITAAFDEMLERHVM